MARAGIFSGLVMAFFLLACADATGPGPLTLFVFSGDGQTGLQGTPLSQPVVVRVVDAGGDPVSEVSLTANPGPNSGRILEADSVSDARGEAAIHWELGEGYENTLIIRLAESPGIAAEARALALFRYTIPDEIGDGWTPSSPATVGMSVDPLRRMMDSIRAGVYEEVHSIVIIKDDRLVFEEYFSGHDFGYFNPNWHGAYRRFDRNTRHNTHSATKSVISALVGLAIDRGLVEDEGEEAFPYFPDYASHATGGKETITIQDMLTMRSGLEWHEWDAPVGGGQNSIDAFNASSDPIGYVLSRPLVHPPGTRFNYSGGTVNVLCHLVARAAGVTVDSFADTHLFGPMGVTNYNFPHHYTGLTVCHGDIYITPRDMAKFGSVYLNGGLWQGERILSEEWIQRSVIPWVSVRDWNLGWAEDYGYLWWIRTYRVGGSDYRSFKALGWGGQEIWVLPDPEMVVVFTGANYNGIPPCDELMVQYILPALEG
jgi:CubicO group peptidase (beta-lactamase class C family)